MGRDFTSPSLLSWTGQVKEKGKRVTGRGYTGLRRGVTCRGCRGLRRKVRGLKGEK